jgi:hypothetical protein
MAMAQVSFGLPLGFLVTHRYDNEARLAGLIQRGGHAWILHGSEDEIIPVAMGRQLAAAAGPKVQFEAIAGGRHNTLMQDALPRVLAVMQAARHAD